LVLHGEFLCKVGRSLIEFTLASYFTYRHTNLLYLWRLGVSSSLICLQFFSLLNDKFDFSID
jgi:hypothetical protein